MQIVTTRVERVTVYRNGALVVRTGECAEGRTRCDALPLLFSSDSLRVRSTTGGVTDVREGCSVSGEITPPDPRVTERARLDLVSLALTDERTRIAGEIEALSRLAPIPLKSQDTPRDVDTASWVALLRTSTDLLVERRAALDDVERRIAAHAAEVARASAHARPDLTPPRFARSIEFTVDAAGSVEIEYFVSAARWVPTYALHLRGDTAELVVAAMIAQATGEDWESARLSFSTADLARDTTLPVLQSWRIGRAQPPQRRAFRPLPTDLPTLFAGFDQGRSSTTYGVTKARGGAPPRPAPPSAPRLATVRADVAEEDRSDVAFDGAAGGAAPSEDDLFDDEATPLSSSAEMRAEGAPMAKSVARARMAAPGAPPMRSAGGGGPPMAGRATAPLPPRLRWASMRLAGPSEAERGRLVPLDVVSKLAWFVEAHDVALVEHLRRAVTALAAAGERLAVASPPASTRPVDDTFAATVFHSTSAHTIPTDGAFWRVEASRTTTKVARELRVVPRESTDVYRFAVMPSSTTPLPYGPLAVFEDDAFRVTTSIDHGARGARPLEVNLGVEPDVRVMGRVAHVHQDEKGLVSQTSRVTHTVKTTLRSSAAAHHDVVVFDRLPVVDDSQKDVKVELVDAHPPARRGEHGPDGHPLKGALSWRVVLAPGATETLEHRYTIDLPAKQELVGGNRRE